MAYISGVYHNAVGVMYRFAKTDEIPSYGETACEYHCYHPKLKSPAVYRVFVIGPVNSIYKLCNHWNQMNRCQKSEFYYEVP